MHNNNNNSDHSEDDYDFNEYSWDYPGGVGSPDSAACSSSADVGDPEAFDYECLKITEVESFLNEAVASLTDQIQVKPSLAKLLLHQNAWCVADIISRYKADCDSFLVASKLKPKAVSLERPHTTEAKDLWLCEVCAITKKPRDFYNLCCGHCYCLQCWKSHVEFQIKQNQSVGIECMDSRCGILLPEDFIMDILTNPEYRAKYQQLAFEAHVLSCPQLQFCPGANCSTVIRAKQSAAKKVTCKSCKVVFCFKCTLDYHAPASCLVIKQWLVKCLDDSETANYITANTKDCPRCHICIEKNGGCNHMQCWKCKHHFCWMCMGDWKTHGSEYYECSRYKENPNIVNEAVHVKAREALQKYLFYYERWENHIKSLDLEEAMLKKIQERIDDKISKKEGTWIDWLYLNDAAALLTKCRYTLQYTYPYAYYIENGPRKQLFEYQQGQLEAEIENLSWKVERAGSTDRGDLENQMHIAEQKRRTLLRDFS